MIDIGISRIVAQMRSTVAASRNLQIVMKNASTIVFKKLSRTMEFHQNKPLEIRENPNNALSTSDLIGLVLSLKISGLKGWGKPVNQNADRNTTIT